MKLKFTWSSPQGDIEKEVNADQGESILKRALAAHVPLPHACEGACACATCHVIVEEGFDQLQPASDREEDMLDFASGLTRHSRLACQLKMPQSNLTLRIPVHNLHTQFPEEETTASNHRLATTWNDTHKLAHQLHLRFPNEDPLRVGLRTLAQWCRTFEGFAQGDLEPGEKRLEAIIAAWHALKE